MTREEAISLLTQVNHILVNSNSWLENTHEPLNIAFDMAIQALDQEPRKGHWIPVYQGDEIIDYRCSECEFGNTFGRGTFGMDFCPRCGSDNREVEV